MYRLLAFIVISFFTASVTPSFAADLSTSTIEVKNIKDSVITSKDNKPFTISAPNSASLIQLIQSGDQIEVVLDSGNPSIINDVKKVSKPCTVWIRLVAFFVSFMTIIGLFSAVTGGSPTMFIIGADNRYSNSKIQVVLWFSAVMTVYLATLGLRGFLLGFDYFGGIGITANLLALSGISTLTYGAAKAITVQKVAPGTTTAAADPAVPAPKSGGTPNICSDLFKNDAGEFDLGDTQMFFFILLAVTTFLIMSFHFLGLLEYAQQITLQDIDTTLLSGLGLGQGAYLAKKAASDAGKG
jgi:hypothetical protein